MALSLLLWLSRSPKEKEKVALWWVQPNFGDEQCFATNSVVYLSHFSQNKTIMDCISPAPTLDLVTRGAAPGQTGSYSSFFFYTNCLKCISFAKSKKVSRCLKCNVLLLKRKTKSPKTTKRKHVYYISNYWWLARKIQTLIAWRKNNINRQIACIG